VEYGEAGFEPHYATEIFRNKYGDCKDQVMLLIAMLKFAGIPAYPVLIGTKGVYPLDEEFPTLLFNHAICLAKVGGKSVFLDPTAETTSFGDLPGGDQGRKVLQRWWIKHTKPILVEEELKGWVNVISPGGKILEYNISDVENLDQPVRIKVKFKGPKFLTKAGENRLVPLLGGISASLVSRERRNYPIDFWVLDTSYMEVKIELPENLTVEYLPSPVAEDTLWFSYLNRYSFSEGSVYFEEKLIRKETVVSPELYKNYKNIYEELARQTDKQVVLKKFSQNK